VHISENKRGISGRSHAAEVSIFKVLRVGGYNNWLTIEAFGLKVPESSPASPHVSTFLEKEEDVGVWASVTSRRLGEVEEPEIGCFCGSPPSMSLRRCY